MSRTAPINPLYTIPFNSIFSRMLLKHKFKVSSVLKLKFREPYIGFLNCEKFFDLLTTTSSSYWLGGV